MVHISGRKSSNAGGLADYCITVVVVLLHACAPAVRLEVVVVGGSRAGHLRKFLEARALIFRPALSEVNFAELLLKRTGSRP